MATQRLTDEQIEQRNKDIKFLWACIKLGREVSKHLGCKSGCLIVSYEYCKEGDILSQGKTCYEQGYTRFGKYKVCHAEREALRRVALECFDIEKITLYSSLEPCYNNNRNNKDSCAELIVDSGIKRVAFACKDPNPSISGFEYLVDSKIEVADYSCIFDGRVEELVKSYWLDLEELTDGKHFDTQKFLKILRKRKAQRFIRGRIPAEFFG